MTHPADEDVFGKCCVWVLDFDERKLDSPFGEVFDQIREFTLYTVSITAALRVRCCSPPVACTLSTLSFEESGWKALTRGEDTENMAHCP